MKTIRSMLVVALAAAMGLAALPALAGGVKMAQTLSLRSGWNAVYIEVAPDETADEVFGAWPVDWVAAYDPAAFLETKQYSGTESTEGARSTGFVMWRRAEGPLSALKRMSANCVYVCFNTNAAGTAAYSQKILGRPAAPRITWHPSSTNEPMNYIGFSVATNKTTTLGDYLDGADIGNVTFQNFYRPCGGNSTNMTLVPVSLMSVSDVIRDGDVVVMTSSKVSNWSGVLYVSPMTGVDFSTNLTRAVVTVRNDGATNRTVTVALDGGQGDGAPPLPKGLKVRVGGCATNEWRDFTTEAPVSRPVASGEELVLELAVDRSQYNEAAGTYFGGLMTITDADGGSNMRVTLPVEVTSDGGQAAANAWPKGLWLAAGVLDTVSYLDDTTSTNLPAGGKMKMRLPLYVDKDRQVTLLQRVTYGVDSNGTTHVYSAATENDFPVPIGNARRLSAAMLPVDQPAIKAGSGSFGGTATVPFVVGEHSFVNPMYHAMHPMHDGLSADYSGPAPSGDDLNNYVTSTTQPELFSITNRITFAWDKTLGTAWSPDETCTGDLVWELDGVRHEGTIRMSGAFSMKRISGATLDK